MQNIRNPIVWLKDLIASAALKIVLSQIRKSGSKSDFSKKVFLKVLQFLPAVPNVPGLEIFAELGDKMVPLVVDMVLPEDGKYFMVQRPPDDPFYPGQWHVPGFCRVPHTAVFDQCKQNSPREFGKDVRIRSIRVIGYFEHPEDRRFHHIALLVACEFTGEPTGGRWFSSFPENVVPQHEKYEAPIRRYLESIPMLSRK